MVQDTNLYDGDMCYRSVSWYLSWSCTYIALRINVRMNKTSREGCSGRSGGEIFGKREGHGVSPSGPSCPFLTRHNTPEVIEGKGDPKYIG